MDPLHKRLSAEQVKLLLQRYREGKTARKEIEAIVRIGKTRFFALLEEYQHAPERLSVAYKRHSPSRLSGEVERTIEQELQRAKQWVNDKRSPISGYNYSALWTAIARCPSLTNRLLFRRSRFELHLVPDLTRQVYFVDSKSKMDKADETTVYCYNAKIRYASVRTE
jgi:hypothetical protein